MRRSSLGLVTGEQPGQALSQHRPSTVQHLSLLCSVNLKIGGDISGTAPLDIPLLDHSAPCAREFRHRVSKLGSDGRVDRFTRWPGFGELAPMPRIRFPGALKSGAVDRRRRGKPAAPPSDPVPPVLPAQCRIRHRSREPPVHPRSAASSTEIRPSESNARPVGTTRSVARRSPISASSTTATPLEH